MYGVGALLALVAVTRRVELPESPRWLVGQGWLEEADELVSTMEERASRHGPLAEPAEDVPMEAQTGGGYASFASVLGNRVYLAVAVVIIQFSVKSRARRFEELSP